MLHNNLCKRMTLACTTDVHVRGTHAHTNAYTFGNIIKPQRQLIYIYIIHYPLHSNEMPPPLLMPSGESKANKQRHIQMCWYIRILRVVFRVCMYVEQCEEKNVLLLLSTCSPCVINLFPGFSLCHLWYPMHIHINLFI